MSFSLGISRFLSKEIFIESTYVVRPHLDLYLAMRVRSVVTPVAELIAKLQGKTSSNVDKQTVAERYDALKNVPFSQIASGVAAHEKDGVAETVYDVNNIKWINHTYTRLDGSVVVIKIPEGQKPPPDGVL